MVCRKLAEKLVEKGYSVDVLTIDEYFHKDKINGVNVIYLNTLVGAILGGLLLLSCKCC